MANMPKTTKRLVGAWIEIETCLKVEQRFGRPDDTSKSVAYIRALEEATRDIQLTSENYRKLAEEVERNEKKRKARAK